MKRKIIGLYAILFVFGVLLVNAIDGTIGFSGIELPAVKGTVKTNAYISKTEFGPQWYRNVGVIDSLLGNRDGVEVKVYVVDYVNGERKETETVNWVNVGDKVDARIQNLNSSTSNYETGTYTIYLRRHTWCATAASHSGGWYLNESILKNLKNS